MSLLRGGFALHRCCLTRGGHAAASPACVEVPHLDSFVEPRFCPFSLFNFLQVTFRVPEARSLRVLCADAYCRLWHFCHFVPGHGAPSGGADCRRR